MTPHEKAVGALNRRLERLQANLREASVESARQFLFQSLVVSLTLGEALNDYLRMVGAYAQRRHGELKQTHDALGAQHAELLKAGKDLLERFKASPADRSLRQELERTQRSMEAIQKNVRRGANALQRELAPSLAAIEPLAEGVRRLAEADGSDALKRALKMIIGQAAAFCASHPALPAKRMVDASAWEAAALAELAQAADFHDAYARAGYQSLVALELMAMAVSATPPVSAEDATTRANESAAARIKALTARLRAP